MRGFHEWAIVLLRGNGSIRSCETDRMLENI